MSEKVEKPVNVKMLYVGNGKRDLNLLHKYYLQIKVCIYFENRELFHIFLLHKGTEV